MKLKEVVIVEGKYDKIKLSKILDALIIDVDGFNIFKNREKVQMIKRLAEKNGAVILTDSDHAGFMIRNYLNGIIPQNKIKHAYIPDILGKERRKRKFSKEGKLGVEGMTKEIILEAIKKAGLKEQSPAKNNDRTITKFDLFKDGFSGTKNSADNRKKLLKFLNLPENLSQNALLKVLNTILAYTDYREIVNKLK